QYDSEDTLFYCDPPYPHESRGDPKAYRYEMSEADHVELASTLHKLRGRVALSGYRCALLDRLYGDWLRVDAPVKNCHSVKKPRGEAVWLNYDPACGERL
ncbi:MAG: DNA adenine methylase, partial [Armatimonadetes bacterium]|nr:DNA adenine methylase [Armatimonadota bacterium]